jgi:glycerophosphoryl diester phosphodiesterase
VDFAAFHDLLCELDYNGYANVEQDIYPAPFDKPRQLPGARANTCASWGLADQDSSRMPLFAEKTPGIVHHMGALDGQFAPPNSLEAIQNSLDAGARFIEVDITALADADYLLVHDAELDSETSGSGLVAECSASLARDLLIRHEGVPTECRAALLSDVVQLLQRAGGEARLQLDFKNSVPFQDTEPLQRLVRLIEPLKERVIVSSGADWQLRKLRKLASWLNLGFDVMWYVGWLPEGEQRDPRDYPKNIGAYGYYDDHMLASGRYSPAGEYLRDRCESLLTLVPEVSVFYLEHHLIAQSLRDGFSWADALHAYGIQLDAWTMDSTNPAAVRNVPSLLAAGVDLFTTNTPVALGKMLHQARPSK